jgi:hypothetical protein
MGVAVIAIVLVSGYIFAHQHLSSRYRLSRTQGWHSYFYVAYRGMIFSLISAALCFTMDYFDCISKTLKLYGFFLSDFNDLLLSLHDIKVGAWAILTLTLAQASAWISLLYYHFFPTRKDKRLMKIVAQNHLESFVFEASYTQFPIIVTLSSRKTYVGICYGDELTNRELDHIALLPYLSGYRDKDDLSFEDTTDYWTHYETEGILKGSHDFLDLDDFRIILPRSEIESYAFFDLQTYIKFKKAEIAAKKEKLAGYAPPLVHPTGFTIRSSNSKQ